MDKKAGKHGFCGAYKPVGTGVSRWETFSLGVFEWVPRASAKGVKRGPVKVRVKGKTSNPDIVIARAKEIAKALDEGTYTGPKNVTVYRLS